MTPHEAIETFQDNVERLFSHAFIKTVGRSKFSYSWKLVTKRTIRDVVRPQENIISGYAALLRGFLSNDDEWALSQLPGAYRNIGASPFSKKKLKEYRKRIDHWLQRPCGFTPQGRHLTNREVLNLYIYGRVLHNTQKKDFDDISKVPLSRDIFMHTVCRCLVTYSGALGAVYTRNQMVLSSATDRAVLPLP